MLCFGRGAFQNFTLLVLFVDSLRKQVDGSTNVLSKGTVSMTVILGLGGNLQLWTH